MQRHPDLFKVKRKPLAAARKSTHNRELLQGHFDRVKETRHSLGTTPADEWNCDETGFRIGINGGNDYVIVSDPHRRVWKRCPDNRNSCTSIEAISAAGNYIPAFIILPGINIPGSWFDNDLDDRVVLTTSENGYTNDWIALQWLKHFDQYSAPSRRSAWRLLFIDGHGSHMTTAFIRYAEDHKIKMDTLVSCSHFPIVTEVSWPFDMCIDIIERNIPHYGWPDPRP